MFLLLKGPLHYPHSCERETRNKTGEENVIEILNDWRIERMNESQQPHQPFVVIVFLSYPCRTQNRLMDHYSSHFHHWSNPETYRNSYIKEKNMNHLLKRRASHSKSFRAQLNVPSSKCSLSKYIFNLIPLNNCLFKGSYHLNPYSREFSIFSSCVSVYDSKESSWYLNKRRWWFECEEKFETKDQTIYEGVWWRSMMS